MSRVSKSPEKFVGRIEKSAKKVISRFQPGRSAVAQLKPTVGEKMKTVSPPLP